VWVEVFNVVKFKTLYSWVGPLCRSVCGYRGFGTTYCHHPQIITQVYSEDGGSMLHKASVITNKTGHGIIQKLIKYIFLPFYRRQYEGRIVSRNSTTGNSLSCDVCMYVCLPVTSYWPLCYEIYFASSAFLREFLWSYLQNIICYVTVRIFTFYRSFYCPCYFVSFSQGDCRGAVSKHFLLATYTHNLRTHSIHHHTTSVAETQSLATEHFLHAARFCNAVP